MVKSLRTKIFILRVIHANEARSIPLRIDDIAEEVFMKRRRVSDIIKLLRQEGAVIARGPGKRGGYQLIAAPEHPLFQYVEAP